MESSCLRATEIVSEQMAGVARPPHLASPLTWVETWCWLTVMERGFPLPVSTMCSWCAMVLMDQIGEKVHVLRFQKTDGRKMAGRLARHLGEFSKTQLFGK